MSVKSFFAWTLMIVGLCVAVLCGGCAIIMTLASPKMIMVPMVIGGVPASIGIALYMLGRFLNGSPVNFHKIKLEEIARELSPAISEEEEAELFSARKLEIERAIKERRINNSKAEEKE